MNVAAAAPILPPTKGARSSRYAPRTDRKIAILLSAERLFAERGYNAVSIRHIAEGADVPIALVSYYYGAKHELFQAIFDRWGSVVEERLQRLALVMKKPATAGTLKGIVQAFVEPPIRLRNSEEGEYYALMVARELGYSHVETDKVMKKYFDPMALKFIDALHQAMPHGTRTQAAWCYQFALGALLQHLRDSRVDRLSKGKSQRNDEDGSQMLVDFIVGGVRAAVPQPRKTTRATTGR